MKESGKYHKIIKLLPYFLLGITVVVFYFVHVQFVFSSDDLYYMTNLATGEPLQHISEIYESGAPGLRYPFSEDAADPGYRVAANASRRRQASSIVSGETANVSRR